MSIPIATGVVSPTAVEAAYDSEAIEFRALVDANCWGQKPIPTNDEHALPAGYQAAIDKHVQAALRQYRGGDGGSPRGGNGSQGGLKCWRCGGPHQKYECPIVKKAAAAAKAKKAAAAAKAAQTATDAAAAADTVRQANLAQTATEFRALVDANCLGQKPVHTNDEHALPAGYQAAIDKHVQAALRQYNRGGGGGSSRGAPGSRRGAPGSQGGAPGSQGGLKCWKCGGPHKKYECPIVK